MDSITSIISKLRENILLTEQHEYETLSDLDLISRAQDGDMYATSVMIQRYEDNGFLSRMCAKYFLPGEDEDDVLQLAREALWDAISSWDKTGNFESFAGMLIKRRLSVEIERAEAGKRAIHNNAYSLNHTTSDSEGNESEFGDTLKSTSQSPEEEYVSREAERKIINYIKSRPELEQQAIKLYIDGYKISEIADKLDRTYKSIESALGRLKSQLRAFLDSEEYNESYEELDEATILTSLEKKILKNIFMKIIDRGI